MKERARLLFDRIARNQANEYAIFSKLSDFEKTAQIADLELWVIENVGGPRDQTEINMCNLFIRNLKEYQKYLLK